MAASTPDYSRSPMMTMAVKTCCHQMHRMTLHRVSTTVTTEVLTADDVTKLSSEECSICLGKYRAGDVTRKLPACGHVFHDRCLWEWIKRGTSCPMCRAPFEASLTTIGRPCDNSSIDPDFEQWWLDTNAKITIFGSPKEKMMRILKLAPWVEQWCIDLEQSQYLWREECRLCQGAFLENDFVSVVPDCQHMFHADCAWDWFKKNESCKFCRSSLRRNFILEVVAEIPKYGDASSNQTQDGTSDTFQVEIVHRK